MSDSSKILIEVDADGNPAEKGLRQTGRAIRTLSKDAQAEARKLAGVYQDSAGKWREANGRFVASARQVELGLKQVGDQNTKTARSFDVVKRSGNGLSKMWSDQARSLQQLERAGIRTGQVVGTLAVGGFAAAVKEGLDFNAQMESNRIGLLQFLGTTKDTDKFLGQLFQTARKTPFEFKDITDAAKKFLAFGFTVDETKRSLSAIGDATAALGGGADKIDRLVIAFGQIQAKGRVQGDELLQLAEAGIPAYQILQQKLGLTAKEMKNIGNVGIQSGDAISALIDGMNERFAGATQRQSKSWKGMWSTIHDDTDQALGAMTKDLFDELEKNWLPKIDKTAQGIAAVWKREDITPEQKFERSRKIIDKELGPLFDKVEKQVADLDIPGKIADGFAAAAPKLVAGIESGAKFAAKTYYEAFLKADPIGKALLAGYAGKKTGAIGLLTGFLKGGGKGAGGILGGLSARGGSPANPMFVAVINDLPGKGGGNLLDDIIKKGGPAALGAAGVTAAGAGAAVVGTAGALYLGAGNGVPAPKGGKGIISDVDEKATTAAEKVKLLKDELKRLDKEYRGLGKSHLDPVYGRAVQDIQREIDKTEKDPKNFHRKPKPSDEAGRVASARITEINAEIKKYREDSKANPANAKANSSYIAELEADKKHIQDYRGSLAQLTADIAKAREASKDRYLPKDDRERAADTVKHLEGERASILKLVNAHHDARRDIGESITALRDTQTGSLADIEKAQGKTAAKIRHLLPDSSAVAKGLLADNFSAAATAIKTQMDAGAISVKAGTEKINKYLTAAMKALGFDKTSIKHYMSTNTGDVSGKGSVDQGQQGAAKGALTRLPGMPGPDSIPIDVNGRKIVAAPGEDVAVINGPQRRFLDQRLSDVGGFGGVFRRMNQAHVPGGEFSGGFATGGMVTGDTDYKPAVGRALEAMAKAKHTPIFVQSGGRTRAEQIALAATRTASHPVAGPNGPHVQGIAADITPGREVFGDVAGRYGLGFTVPQESWHVQLIDAAVASGQVSQAEGAKLKAAKWDGPGGMVGALGKGGLAGYQSAAQALLDRVSGGGSGSSSADGGSGPGIPDANASGNGADLMRQISKQRGWNFGDWWALDGSETSHGANLANPTSTARLRGQFLDSNYGKYGPGSDPAQNPSMGQQIESMAAYVAERYGNPTKAWAFHQVHNWYAKGGWVGAAKGDPPAYSDWRTRANPTTTKKKKPKKQPKPYTSGPGYPNLSKIKGKKPKAGSGAWKSSHTSFALPDGWDGVDPGVVPDFEALFDGPAETIGNQIEQLTGQFGLSDETPVVSLTDTGSFTDLTAFWAAHPDLAKDYKDQVSSWDVINWDTMTVQGKQTPGIHPHTRELEQLLGLHSGTGDGTGAGGLLGIQLAEIASKGDTTTKLSVRRDMAVFAMRQIRQAWDAEADRREHARTKVKKLNAGGQSWQQRVSDNDARIKALRDWKRKVSADAVGHRKTEQLQKQESKADQDIADLSDENTTLKDTHPAPKKAIPKGASAKERARITASNAQRSRQLGHWTAVRDDAARELDYLDGSRERWQTTDGVAKGWQDRIDAHNTLLKQLADDLKQMTESTVPSERLEIARLAQERGDWLGTTVTLPALQAGGTSAKDAEMAALLKEQLTAETTKRIVAESQFGVFSGFAPLVSGRMLGSFAKGTIQPIAETGPAILHKGEVVSPDPRGPYGLDQRTTTTASGGATHITFGGDLAPFIKLIDARIGQKAPDIVSKVIGSRQRMISISPGGR